MSNSIDKNLEVIENLRSAGKSENVVYAYAFGMAWAWLTDEARLQILKATLDMVKESK